MIDLARQAAADEGVTVSMTKLCQWFGIPRRSAYYRSQRSAPKVQPRFVEPIKAMIEENPSFGYRTVAHLLNFNKNTVQRWGQCLYRFSCGLITVWSSRVEASRRWSVVMA